MSIYVERIIEADRDRIWELTQTPEMHERWDLRFTRIRYLPKVRAEDPQSFEYETRVGFLTIRGTGTTAGERRETDGASTSALVFGSSDRRSLIRKGSGYWRYVADGEGRTRFITAYDYAVRWGAIGWILDRLLFRPLMAWATAWSFDRLAMWASLGAAPERSWRISVAQATARITVAGIWLYEGIFPKLAGPRPEELMMTIRAGIPAGWAVGFVMGLGAFEVVFGVLILALWQRRWPLVVSAAAMVPALIGAARAAPELLAAPFNVVVINWMAASLSLIALCLHEESVRATQCRWSAYGKGVRSEAAGGGNGG
jgi:hypothetical protein